VKHMNDITFDYFKCDDTIKIFGEDKLKARWIALFEEMNLFIIQNNLTSVVDVDKFLLSTAILDYFNDIKRLKDFHNIVNTNSIKVTAYTAYWLLRRKPLQVCNSSASTINKELITVNERFVLKYICNYLSVRERTSHILLRENKGLKSFSGMLLYYLIYRVHDAHSLEMMLMAFFSGQVYERTDEDISVYFHPYDLD